MSGSSRNLGIQITATNTANASIQSLQATLKGLQATLRDVGGSAADAGGRITASIEAEIGAINREIAARGGQAAAIRTVTAAMQEQATAAAAVHRTLQEGINISGGGVAIDRQINSARASMATFATSLSTAAAADAVFRDEQLAVAAATNEAAAALARQGAAVKTLTGEQFFGLYGRRMGMTAEPISAAQSAETFKRELGPPGGAITAVETQATINTLHGINREMTSARVSAEAFKEQLAAVGSGVISVGTQSTINTLQGVNRQMISARESAGAFARELGTVGGAVRTIPAASFNRLVADLVGVKQNYLSAAESAKVFEAAGVSAAEKVLLATGGMSATMAAGAGAGMASAGSILTKESRHIVGMFDSLARGQRGQFISSIGAAARDAGLGIAGLSTSIGGLVAIMGGAALIRGAENIGKWATETRAAASAAGMSVSQYSGLQGALTLTGLKASEADSVLSHFAVNLATATADGSSKAAEGYHHLGISQEELVSNAGNVHAMLLRLADAFASAENSANRDAAVNEIAGRGFRELIKVIQDGGPALKDLEDKAKSLGITLTDETAASAEKAGNEIRMLGSVLRGEFDQALIESMPNIVAVAKALNTVVNVLYDVIAAAPRAAAAIVSVGSSWQSSGFVSMEGGLAAPGRGLGAVGAPSTSFSTSAKTPEASGLMPGEVTGGAVAGRYVPPPASKGADTAAEAAMRNAMVTDALAAEEAAKKAGASRAQISMKGTQAEIADMQKLLNAHTLNALDQTRVDTEMKEKQISLLMQGVSASASAAKRAQAAFIASERDKIASADGSSAKIQAIYTEMLSTLATKYKASSTVLLRIDRERITATNAAKLREIKERASEDERQMQLTVTMSKAQAIAGGTAIVPGQKTIGGVAPTGPDYAGDAQRIMAINQTRIDGDLQVLATEEKGSTNAKAAAQDILAAEQESISKRIELYNQAGEVAIKAAQKAQEAFTKVFDNIGKGMETFSDSLLKALIAPQEVIQKVGLTSIKTSMRGREIEQAAGKMIMGLIDDVAKGIETGLSHTAAQALSKMLQIPMTTGGGLGDLLSSGLTKMLGIGGSGGAPGAAQFGLAGTQLQLAATQLQAAALALHVSSATSSGAGALSGASAAAATQPIVSAVASSSAENIAVTQTAAVTTSTATTTGTSILGSIIEAGNALTDTLLGALNLKPSFLGFTYAQGGIVPSAQSGMVVGGTGGTLAVLHAREMVLPAPISRGMQEMISRGGVGGIGGPSNTANLNYSPTINTGSRGRGGTGLTRAEFSQMMSLHGGALLGEARNMIRAGWRPG